MLTADDLRAATLAVLDDLLDTAEYWFDREDRRGMSDADYKMWHALGYGSNAYRHARDLQEKLK